LHEHISDKCWKRWSVFSALTQAWSAAVVVLETSVLCLEFYQSYVLRTAVKTVHVTYCYRQCCFTKSRTNSGYTSSKNVFVSQNPTEVQSAAITITIYIRIIYHTDDNVLKTVIKYHGWYSIKAAVRE